MAYLEMAMFLKRCEECQHDICNETGIDKAFKDQECFADVVIESYSQWHKDTGIDKENSNP